MRAGDLEEFSEGLGPGDLEIRAAASTFYLACVRAGMMDEGAEFAEWYLDTFDHDLET